MCIDYTNLNNACPKNSFPLPQIDQIMDSTTGHGMLSFLDAFSGYHQILMAPTDEEKNCLYNAAWTQKRRRHLPKTDDKDLQALDQSHGGSVH